MGGIRSDVGHQNGGALGCKPNGARPAGELGLDRAAAFRVLAASSGDSFMLRRAVDTSHGGVTLAASRLRKDLALLECTIGPSDVFATALAGAAGAAVGQLEQLAAEGL